MIKKEGFTLIELVITIAIIGILAATALPMYSNYQRKARAIEAKVMLGAIRNQEVIFFETNSHYSESLTSLGNPTVNSKYYTFSITASANDFTATASPNATATQLGLTGVWTSDKSANLGGSAITSGNNY